MYMAPEFFTGENPSYGRSVDIFAMGMLFLTMLQAEAGQPLLSPKTGNMLNKKKRLDVKLISYLLYTSRLAS